MQLETPNDIALDMADAELTHTTLLTTEGATCVAVPTTRSRSPENAA